MELLRKGGFHLGVAETPASFELVSRFIHGLTQSLSLLCLCLFFRFPCPSAAGHRSIALNIIVKVLPRVGITTVRTIYVIVS